MLAKQVLNLGRGFGLETAKDRETGISEIDRRATPTAGAARMPSVSRMAAANSGPCVWVGKRTISRHALPVALRRVRPPVQDRRPYAGADTFPVRKTFEIVEHGRRWTWNALAAALWDDDEDRLEPFTGALHAGGHPGCQPLEGWEL